MKPIQFAEFKIFIPKAGKMVIPYFQICKSCLQDEVIEISSCSSEKDGVKSFIGL